MMAPRVGYKMTPAGPHCATNVFLIELLMTFTVDLAIPAASAVRSTHNKKQDYLYKTVVARLQTNKRMQVKIEPPWQR